MAAQKAGAGARGRGAARAGGTQQGQSTSGRKSAQPADGQSGPAGRTAPSRKAAQAAQARTAKAGQAAATRPQNARTAVRDPAGKARAGGSAAARDTSPAAGWRIWRPVASYARDRKLEFSTLVLSLLGLAVSIYLTYEEFTTNTPAGCSANIHSFIDCEQVLSSPQSHVFGIPVAVLGLAFYVFMAAVNTPLGWRASWPAVHWLRLGSVIAGICFVLYLVWAELFKIGHLCEYCTVVHLLTFLLFALIVSRATLTGLRPAPATS